MTAKRPIPPPPVNATRPSVTSPPPPKPTADTVDPVLLTLYAAALQGLVMRSDLEWHPDNLAMRAMVYAEAAYKTLTD